MSEDYSEPTFRLSKALAYMVSRVDNKEARQLRVVAFNPESTHGDYVDASFDFLQSIPAFGDVKTCLSFIDKHLIKHDEYDDTLASDVPDYWIDLHT